MDNDFSDEVPDTKTDNKLLDGEKYLKIAGAMLAIYGFMNAVASLTSIFDMVRINLMFLDYTDDINAINSMMNVLYIVTYIAIAVGVFQVVTGGIGIAFSGKKGSAKVCIILGASAFILDVLVVFLPLILITLDSNITFFAELGIGEVGFATLITKVALSAVFIYGGVKKLYRDKIRV